MSVTGPGPVQGGFPVRPVQSVPPRQPVSEPPSLRPVDEVEISSTGRMLDQIQQSGQIRAERLEKIKADIAAGTYETPEKLEAALERLLAQIAAEPDQNSP